MDGHFPVSDKAVHAMNKSWHKSNTTTPDDQGQRSRKERESGRLCSWCGRKHVGKQVCPAKGKVCFKCKKFNHYSQMCRSKTVHEVETSNKLSYEDGDFFIGVVNEVSDTKGEISVQLLVEGSDSIKVKLQSWTKPVDKMLICLHQFKVKFCSCTLPQIPPPLPQVNVVE